MDMEGDPMTQRRADRALAAGCHFFNRRGKVMQLIFVAGRRAGKTWSKIEKIGKKLILDL